MKNNVKFYFLFIVLMASLSVIKASSDASDDSSVQMSQPFEGVPCSTVHYNQSEEEEKYCSDMGIAQLLNFDSKCLLLWSSDPTDKQKEFYNQYPESQKVYISPKTFIQHVQLVLLAFINAGKGSYPLPWSGSGCQHCYWNLPDTPYRGQEGLF